MPGPKSIFSPAERKRKRALDAIRCYYRHQEEYKAASNNRRKKRWANNPEAEREYDRNYFLKNKERIRETARLRSLADREAFNSYQREWNRNNPEKYKAHAAACFHKRRKWMLESPNPPTSKQIQDLLALAHCCHYCAKPFGQKRLKTIDHVIPRTRDGIHELSNLVVACRSCNCSKSDRDPHEFARELGMLMLV